jgi:type II secretory pathway component HofQ
LNDLNDVEPMVEAAVPGVGSDLDPDLPGGGEGPELVSSTLAELYFNQGFTDKALDVYRQLLEREPGNERARARMKELRALDEHLKQEEAREPKWAGSTTPAAASPELLRRQAVERTIARLEALLAAARKQ